MRSFVGWSLIRPLHPPRFQKKLSFTSIQMVHTHLYIFTYTYEYHIEMYIWISYIYIYRDVHLNITYIYIYIFIHTWILYRDVHMNIIYIYIYLNRYTSVCRMYAHDVSLSQSGPSLGFSALFPRCSPCSALSALWDHRAGFTQQICGNFFRGFP